MRTLLITALLVVAASCADVPPPKFMLAENMDRIVIGHSTDVEVRKILGNPQQIKTSSDQAGASVVWSYQYLRRGTYELIPSLREKLSKPALHSILTVQFDTQRVVEKVDRVDREIRTPEEGGILVPF